MSNGRARAGKRPPRRPARALPPELALEAQGFADRLEPCRDAGDVLLEGHADLLGATEQLVAGDLSGETLVSRSAFRRAWRSRGKRAAGSARTRSALQRRAAASPAAPAPPRCRPIREPGSRPARRRESRALAVAYVRPSRSLDEVDPHVVKKMKEPAPRRAPTSR